MTFFLHHGGFPKVACVVRDGTVAGICLFWFPEQPIFTFLSSQTEENSGPALAGLVLQMREDLPLDSYIVIGISHWTHIFLKWKNRESPEAKKLNSWVSLLSFFWGGWRGGEHSPSNLWQVPGGSLLHNWGRYDSQTRLTSETNLTFLCNNMSKELNTRWVHEGPKTSNPKIGTWGCERSS